MIKIPELLAQFETRLLKDKLFDYPERIACQKETLAEARKELAEARVALEEAEAILKSVISAEVNPATGKPAYSNAEARAAEFINRKKDDFDCQAAEKKRLRCEEEYNSEMFLLEKLQDEFRSCRYVADLTARELALLAGDSQSESREVESREAMLVGAGAGSRQPY